MRLYASSPVLRARQIVADLGLLAWLVLWVLVARAVTGAVLVLAEPGRAIADLGSSVAGSMDAAADAALGVPVVGDDLAAPFESLSGAGGDVGGAGRSAEGAVDTLAPLLAVRALATAPLPALAGLELRRLGLGMPAPQAAVARSALRDDDPAAG